MLGGRVRFLAQIHDAPGTPLNLNPTTAELQKIVDERIGGVTITTPHWVTCFEIHHGQVPEYRHGGCSSRATLPTSTARRAGRA